MASVVLSGDTSGSVSLTVPAVAGTNTATVPAQTGTLEMLGVGTAVNSTSGTSIDFTGIPSWVKRITVMFNGVSTNGSSQIVFQIGSGSVTTSGYVCTVGSITATAANNQNNTNGWNVGRTGAGDSIYGQIIFSLLGSNFWVGNGGFSIASSVSSFPSGGIGLSGTIDRVRITTANGTDTFDAGSINIIYEG